MAIKNPLNTEAKKILTKHIKTILSNCKIDRGSPDFKKEADEAFYKYLAEVKKHRNQWMDDEAAINLLYKQISDYLDDLKKSEFSGNFKDIDGTKGIISLCKKIILFLDSIPREYFIFFELPATKGIGIKELSLTNDVSFVEKLEDDDFSEIKIQRRNGGMGLLGLYGSFGSLKKGQIYVRIRIEGCMYNSFESIAVKKAFSKFKQVILLGKYSDILIEAHSKLGKILRSDLNMTSEIIVWNPLESSYIFNTKKAFADHISKIYINEKVLMPGIYDFFDNFENKDNPTTADKAKLLKKRFDKAIKLLNTSDDDKNSEPIKTAIEWAFESLVNDNETFAFIQACIGLEAILGDDINEEAITRTLADRCAYLIGSSIAGRKKIKENFLKLYKDRSKLVHGRKVYLNREERGKLRYAQNILMHIILKEISYIE